MLDNNNYSLDEALDLINSHKIKSRTLKDCYLKNINKGFSSEILGYLGELEYDLETLYNLIFNFRQFYCNSIGNTYDSSCNINWEIDRLNNDLNKAKNDIINLKKENNLLKKGENGNKIIFNYKNEKNNEEIKNRLNKTYNEFENYKNGSDYNLCVYNNNRNLYEPNNGLDKQYYGRLTYVRHSNETNNIQRDNNYINIPSYKINNKNKKKIVNKSNNNNSKNNNINNLNNINSITDQNMNKDITNLIDNINNINVNSNNNNGIFDNKINNKNEKENLYNNMNNCTNNNIYTNNNIPDDVNFDNNKNINGDQMNNIFENINPIERKNFSSYNIPNSQSSIMSSKRIIPKYHYQNQTFNSKISKIQKGKDNKMNRINNILSVILNDENKLNEIKSIFGNNIDSQLLNGDINDEYLEKIEKYLCYMGSCKSVIPLSKRFQIQSRAKSNSFKKLKKFYNNDKNHRFMRQRLSARK